jgi:putative tryptophan/tyrosine transport system substrate-binding protein
MRRREVITLLVGGAVFRPLAVRAQPTVPTVGLIFPASAETSLDRVAAFRRGLNEVGYAENQNLKVEYRYANDRIADMSALAGDLAAKQVSVIFAAGVPAISAAKNATKTIPIVFLLGGDPVALGLVASFNHPGGNLTGLSNLNFEVGPKRLELLHEVVPSVDHIAFLVNPTNRKSTAIQSDEMQATARTLGSRLDFVSASAEADLEGAFDTLVGLGARGLVIANDGLFISRATLLGTMAARKGIPAIYQFREFAASGGLMSYGSNTQRSYHDAGVYVGRILKGEKPSDLPIQQSTDVELILNLKIAKALSITIPLTLLGRADEVIE